MEEAWLRRASRSPCLQTVRFDISQLILNLITDISIWIFSLLKTKESVVLYVAHDNKAAAKVYHRVGFVGLDGKDCTTEDVEPWLEIGFDRDMVELGHW
jgi:hypothetical protein